ncbi:MAG: YlmC/YmxH family sporulation protein [Mycoplasmatota bacterium]|nr:YlmC/YmxH family sporulation protein [Mycoplasmatota bacterium]
MRLSDLQLKEIVNIYNGKRIGIIVDAVVDEKGYIKNLILEEKRGRKFSREEYNISWTQIIKIGDDIILVDTRNK